MCVHLLLYQVQPRSGSLYRQLCIFSFPLPWNRISEQPVSLPSQKGCTPCSFFLTQGYHTPVRNLAGKVCIANLPHCAQRRKKRACRLQFTVGMLLQPVVRFRFCLKRTSFYRFRSLLPLLYLHTFTSNLFLIFCRTPFRRVPCFTAP